MAGRYRANAEPLDAVQRDGQGHADDRAPGKPVGDRAMRGQVDMPALVIMADQFRLDRILNKERVHPRNCAFLVARGGRMENGGEFIAQVLEHDNITPGDWPCKAVAKSVGACLRRAERVRLSGSLNSGVGEANR